VLGFNTLFKIAYVLPLKDMPPSHLIGRMDGHLFILLPALGDLRPLLLFLRLELIGIFKIM
jgi:hypothetical protein